MKKYITILIGLITLLLFSNCELEVSDNRDIDGFWQLIQVDTIKTASSIDYRGERVFWSFQKDMMQVQRFLENKTDCFVCKFEYDGHTLSHATLLVYDRIKGDHELTDTEMQVAHISGIQSSKEEWNVKKIDRKKLQLSDGNVCLHFTRY